MSSGGGVSGQQHHLPWLAAILLYYDISRCGQNTLGSENKHDHIRARLGSAVPDGGAGTITMGHLLGVERDEYRLHVVKS
jgi:hypothetical protein